MYIEENNIVKLCTGEIVKVKEVTNNGTFKAVSKSGKWYWSSYNQVIKNFSTLKNCT